LNTPELQTLITQVDAFNTAAQQLNRAMMQRGGTGLMGFGRMSQTGGSKVIDQGMTGDEAQAAVKAVLTNAANYAKQLQEDKANATQARDEYQRRYESIASGKPMPPPSAPAAAPSGGGEDVAYDTKGNMYRRTPQGWVNEQGQPYGGQ
jgi:hypothetical protein